MRKIDLMMVVKDDQGAEAEKHRINFLINVIKSGLEIELETGIVSVFIYILDFAIVVDFDIFVLIAPSIYGKERFDINVTSHKYFIV